MLLQPHGSIVANFVLHIFGLFWRNPWRPFTAPWLKNTALWDCCRRGIFARVEFANPRWSSCSLMAVVRVSRTFNLLQIYVIYIFIYLTTTSGRPESECTLRRVMSSEPIQDEQLTRDANRRQTINKRLQARVDTLTADVPPWTKNSSSAILSARDSDENMLP